MPTTFTNAVKVYQTLTSLAAEELGYVDATLRGTQVSKLIPIVEPEKFMLDEYYERKLPTQSVVQTRRINTNPDAKAVNRYEQKSNRTILFGTKAEIDYKELQAKPDELDNRIEDAQEDTGYVIDYQIFNGDPDTSEGEEFHGLKSLSDSSNTFNNGAALSIGTSATTMRTFMSIFRKAKRSLKVGAGAQVVACMNEGLLEGIYKGRDQMGANVLGTKHFDLLNDDVEMLDNTPLIIIRQDDIGNDILPFSETNSSSSIYLMVIGGAPAEGSKRLPNGIYGLSSGGVQQTPEVEGNIRRVTLDFEYGVRVPKRSFARVSWMTE